MNYVLKRDRGICGDCGRDTIQAERDFRAAWKIEKSQYGDTFSQHEWPERLLKDQFGFGRGRWREVDHVIPVVLGGGLLGVGNLRLLCGACHQRATRQLSARRAANR